MHSSPTMTQAHAVVWIDHHRAQVLQFDAASVQVQKVQTHRHDTKQHGSAVRAEHEFYDEVCDELEDLQAMVVAGGPIPLADFRHYVEKQRPAIGTQIVAWETVDHPTEGELVAFGRHYFANA